MQESELTISLHDLLLENQKQKAEIAYLKQELANLKRLIFGKKSERFIPADSNQLDMELDGCEKLAVTEPETETITYERHTVSAKNKPSRNVLPAHLRREEIVIQPDEDITGLSKIGEEITEELEYTPGTLHVNRYVRPKYARPNGACPEHGRREGVVIGMLPNRAIEKGIPGPGLLAHVLVSKFVDHLPVYRQAQMLKRQGVEIARSTIGDWIKYSCEALQPLHSLHREKVLAASYLMADETPIRVLDYTSAKKSHLGYFWVYFDPVNKQALFDYRRGRGREGPAECLENFSGLLQNDGYQAYEQFEARQDITLFSCWAHARRYFDKAQDNDPERARYALTEIQKLYAVEREARENELSYADRQEMRKNTALPVLEKLESWLRQNHLTTLPESAIGKAITYALKRWDKLTRYVMHGQVEIDNNLIENAIRPVALGRKNYLFAGSHAGAERAAMIYSLVATAKLRGIEPFAWLRHTLSKIADHPHKKLAELLPN